MTRQEFLQLLIDRRDVDYYLEVGAQKGKTFNVLRVGREKVGVDPHGSAATFHDTSDNFFKVNEQRFDLIFVDGLHLADQALRDVENALAVLRPGGIIVMHDCNPITEDRQRVPSIGSGGWNGDVWKAFVALRSRLTLDCACGEFDQGMGVVLPRANTQPLNPPESLDYAGLEANRREWLRLMPAPDLLKWIGDY